ncbi:MAG: TolC family protein [Desulfobacterales bacterium]
MTPHRNPFRRHLCLVLLTSLALSVFPILAAAQKAAPLTSGETDISHIRVLDLETAQRIALADNPSFAAAAARVRQAKARLSQARALYLPRVDINWSAAQVRMSDSAYQTNLATARVFDPLATIDDSGDYYTARLTAGWIFFNGFERHFTHAAARYGAELSQSSRKDIKRLLLSGVSSAYYAAQLGMENIHISEADEVFNRRQLLEARARRRVGTGSLSDELNFEVRVNAARAQLIQAKQIHRTAMFSLAALMGLSDGAFPSQLNLAELEMERPEEMAPLEVDPHIERARENRPDIVRSQWAVKLARSEVGIARSKFLPTLNLSAGMDGDRTGDSDFERGDFGDTLALTVSYNLFAGGLHHAKLREAKAQRDEAEKKEKDLTIAVNSQVRIAVTRVTSAQDQLTIQRENAALVKRNRDLVEKEYKAGQGSLVRLNQAQRDLIGAQSRLALALVSLRQAWDDLRTETGQILMSASDS